MSKDISIIIIVKNDLEVFNTLDSLLALINNKIEIIVVDSSDKPLSEVYKKSKEITWIRFKSNSEKKITIPEQRNVGVKNAKGNIIVFVDASCIPDRNWLHEITYLILSKEEHIVAGSIHSLTNNKRQDIRNQLLKNNKYLNEAPTMNLAIDKLVFDKIGYFNETFDYGSDVDLTLRAIENGFKIRYNPKAILYHNWGGFKDELKRAFRYGEARVNIYKNHKKDILTILRTDPITVIYPVFIIFLPIIFFFPWYLLFLLIPLFKNIKQYPLETSILNLTYGAGILFKLVSR